MALATMADAVREFVQNTCDDDPKQCRCGGGGWILSNYDTWHSCPRHSGPHPEEMEQEYYAELQAQEHKYQMATNPAYAAAHEEFMARYEVKEPSPYDGDLPACDDPFDE